MKRFRWGHYLKTSLWVVPLLIVLAGMALSLLITAIDDGTLVSQEVSGDPAAALQILYLISFSMLTLTGLVLSLVVVVVQLAMGIFSPRIVRQILQDRPSQAAIGLFGGTFAFALLATRKVKTSEGGGSVPGLAVIVAIGLVLVCILTLIWYVNHIGQSLRVAALVGWVAKDTLETLEHVYPDEGDIRDVAPDVLTAPRSGVIFAVDQKRLVNLATSADCRLELLWSVGDYVPVGSALIRVVGDPKTLRTKRAVDSIALGPERTLNEDVAYGIRMLVDIAEQSLSSGPFSDPTTAVQAIDRLHDILRQLARRPLRSGHHHDAAGTLRFVAPAMSWEGYVRLAFDEIRQVGTGSPQVTRRLRAALDDLLRIAPADRQEPLRRQLEMLEERATQTTSTRRDQREAVVPDPAGIGSGVGLVVNPAQQDE